MANPDFWRMYTEKVVRKWTSGPIETAETQNSKAHKHWPTTWFGLFPHAMAHWWQSWRSK